MPGSLPGDSPSASIGQHWVPCPYPHSGESMDFTVREGELPQEVGSDGCWEATLSASPGLPLPIPPFLIPWLLLRDDKP